MVVMPCTLNVCAQLEANGLIEEIVEMGATGRNEEQTCIVGGEEYAYLCPIGYPDKGLSWKYWKCRLEITACSYVALLCCRFVDVECSTVFWHALCGSCVL